jgi:cyclophilin family peptidyl-prolyl cis-trans isomerase
MTQEGSIVTKHGKIILEFYPDVAPKTVMNFCKLANSGFYDHLLFHRIVPGFVIQGGDPNTRRIDNRQLWGTGGPGWTIESEFSSLKHTRGIISMARSHDPNSAGSQFFIVLKDSYFLDGNYTIFGKVLNGMEVVDAIASITTDSNDAPLNIQDAEIMSVKIGN